MSVPGKQVQNGTYEFDYMRVPDTRTRWEVIRDGIYNPAEGTYCGHTCKKWAITATFYGCFFAGLAVFFTICMQGLLATISNERPKWILDKSLIGINPGLGYRPMPENPDERSLIWYDASNATDVKKWTNLLDTFLAAYKDPKLLPNEGRNQQVCSYTQPPKAGNVCEVDIRNWGPCSPTQKYGFNNSSPCVFIKLNRIYGWVPQYYNDTNDLPAEMPRSLVKHIQNVDSSWLNTVWVSCKGEDPHDVESIGELDYYPKSHGFPGFYYPYENTPGYLSPVVAVHFLRPARNQIINVECRAWAKNIEYQGIRAEKKGAVHFELQVD